MKSKFLIFGIIITLLFINILTNTCIAGNDEYTITIKDKSAEYIKTKTIGGNTFEYYNISITLHNSGNIISDNITVELADEDKLQNLTKEYSIKPGEDKTYTFSDHPLMGSGEHTLYINYYATDMDKRNAGNTGSTTFIINEKSNNDNDKGIPGFELVFLITSIILIFLINKKKKKRKIE